MTIGSKRSTVQQKKKIAFPPPPPQNSLCTRMWKGQKAFPLTQLKLFERVWASLGVKNADHSAYPRRPGTLLPSRELALPRAPVRGRSCPLPCGRRVPYSSPCPVFSGIARQTEGGLSLFLAGGFPSPSRPRGACGEGRAEVVPTPQRPAPCPGLLVSVLPPFLQTGKRRRGAEPSPSPEITQPLFQHHLPFGLAPFQKPSPPTPFFPAFLLLLASPSLSNTPPSPRLAPASPRRPKLLPQDRGMRLSSGESCRSPFLSGEPPGAVRQPWRGGVVGGLGRRWLTEGGGSAPPFSPSGAAAAPGKAQPPRPSVGSAAPRRRSLRVPHRSPRPPPRVCAQRGDPLTSPLTAPFLIRPPPQKKKIKKSAQLFA